ncbi:MAG TPA: peptidoglycan-binding domain-containing protein, partial [Pyrinomonadaceae bacterium]|nr:peptidoglycan-binding domain-containing protein [Pyrinomonadaceae bacterium]
MILKLGDHGEKVKRLKRALNGFGFNLNEDGFFDGATDTAVREFQKDNGLVVNGSAGSSTLSALGLDPDTLEELSDGDGDVNVIVFNEDEAAVDVPPVVRNKISTFVELVAR